MTEEARIALLEEQERAEARRNLKPLRNKDGTFPRKFKANGHTYIIRTRDEGLGIVRTSEFMKMEIVNGIGMSITDVIDYIRKLKNEINNFGRNKGNFVETGLLIKALEDDLMKITRKRYAVNFMFLTLFIVREGEDLTRWEEDEQNEKIDDWNKEGYNENDFLALGLDMVQGFAETFRRYSQQPGSKENEAEQSTSGE